MRTLFAFFTGVALFAADSHRLTQEDLLSAEPIGDAALSPDGKTFALTRAGQIALMPAEGGWPVTLTSSAGGKSGLSWSPDSRAIAYASQGSIWTVGVDGGPPKRLTHAFPGEGDPRQASDRAPQWSPKGRWILFQTGRRGHEDLVVISEDGRTESYITHRQAMQVMRTGRPTDCTSHTRTASRSTSAASWTW
jgi:Tol biopolymer transport system component